jgi:hypothetical protein
LTDGDLRDLRSPVLLPQAAHHLAPTDRRSANGAVVGATRQNIKGGGRKGRSVRNRHPVLRRAAAMGPGFYAQTGEECSHATHNYKRRIGVPGYVGTGLIYKRGSPRPWCRSLRLPTNICVRPSFPAADIAKLAKAPTTFLRADQYAGHSQPDGVFLARTASILAISARDWLMVSCVPRIASAV